MGGRGGVPDRPLGPRRATTFDHPSLYAARLVERRPGDWVLLGFRDTEDGAFVGEIADPLPVVRDGDRLRLATPQDVRAPAG